MVVSNRRHEHDMHRCACAIGCDKQRYPTRCDALGIWFARVDQGRTNVSG